MVESEKVLFAKKQKTYLRTTNIPLAFLSISRQFHILVSHQSSKKKWQVMTHIGPSDFQSYLNLLPGLYLYSKKEEKNHYDSCAYQYFDNIGAKADFLFIKSWTDDPVTRLLYFTVLK